MLFIDLFNESLARPLLQDGSGGQAMGCTLTVLLMAGQGRYWQQAEAALLQSGCRVEVFDGPLAALEKTVRAVRPDVVMVAADAMEGPILERVCLYGQLLPHPVVVFTEDPDLAKVRRAVDAGVAAYVVAGLAPGRLLAVLEAARTRHTGLRSLKEDLARTRDRLAAQEAIDAAKTKLMDEGLSEPEAHALLRRLAMEAGISKAEAARRLLARTVNRR